MHIPDGYLSPSTCTTLYALSSAGWYWSLRRVKGMLSTRTIPMISVMAAFSFVVMMFNVPLPGGTTGHALGVTVSTIVLGPWGSTLAISIALAIQALFFGDGGITTLGANCFNMAIAGSLAAYVVYRVIAGKSEIKSSRRIAASAIAGYVAVNVAAFLAAVEFGIQPVLFHDASGTPLYAPFPLRIAVPAMMIGHLTFAGLAEAAISAGMISYLQRANPGLIDRRTLDDATPPALNGTLRPVRRLWLTVALLMLLTPAGILAVGTTWGEWSSTDYENPQARAAMTAASGDHAPPPAAPSGLRRLSSLWTAPFPGYAPPFIKSPSFGYLLSAMFGVGVLVLTSLLANVAGRRLRQTRLRS
jgi:cobalt/nickel transport system permease protein